MYFYKVKFKRTGDITSSQYMTTRTDQYVYTLQNEGYINNSPYIYCTKDTMVIFRVMIYISIYIYIYIYIYMYVYGRRKREEMMAGYEPCFCRDTC